MKTLGCFKGGTLSEFWPWGGKRRGRSASWVVADKELPSHYCFLEVIVGIRPKLSIMIVLCVILMTGVIGWIAIRNEEDFLRQDVELKGRQMLRALAIPCAVPLANHRLNELDDYI